VRIVKLSNKQARHFLLTHQGLGVIEPQSGKMGVMDFIRRVGCIQFDPLNIVGRNPELVLQARITDFRPAILQELLYNDRILIDGMDKVMSIYMTEDWPYFQRFRDTSKQRYGSIDSIVKSLPEVREMIEKIGPISSGDLQLNQTIDWAWAPTRLSRAVLESMYFWGELIVHHKKNNQKVYDFAHRNLSPNLLQTIEPNLTDEEHLEWRVLRRIGAIGFLWEKAGDAWIGISGLKAKERKQSIHRLWSLGRLTQLHIEGMGDSFYAKTEDVERLSDIILNLNTTRRAAIMAPLDNLLWDRRMIKSLFGFDYTWEVYKPMDKRSYGYYVLPVLYGDIFVARFEPGRVKKEGSLIIKNWWWEPGITPSYEMMCELKRCFQNFIRFLGTKSICIEPEIVLREGLEDLI
jgi:uncharacterized protein YcaQ